MSLVNKLVYRVCRSSVVPYEKGKIDYPKKREKELKQTSLFKAPRKVNIENIIIANTRCHKITKNGNFDDRVFFYIHGGGFVVGSIDARKTFTTYLVNKTGYNLIAVEYPLAPEHPFPEGLDSCYYVYNELLKTYKAKNIIVIGESAGGNLVLSLLLKLKENNKDIPRLAFSLSPCVQFEKVLDSYTKNLKTEAMVFNLNDEVIDNYLQGDKKMCQKPLVSPIYGDFKGICPIYLYASTSEVLYDDAILMYNKLKQDNVKTELFIRKNMVHTWVTIPYIREARKDIKKMMEIINTSFEE